MLVWGGAHPSQFLYENRTSYLHFCMKLSESEFEQMQRKRKVIVGGLERLLLACPSAHARIEQGHSFVFPYPPSVNEIYKPVPTRKGTMTLRLSAKGREFKERIGWEAKKQGAQLLTGNLCVTYRLYRPQKSGDLENRLKAMADALQGIAYKDDKQIVEIHAYRFDDKDNPRIEVDLREV